MQADHQFTSTRVPVTRKKHLLQTLQQVSTGLLHISITHCGLSSCPIPRQPHLKTLDLTSNKLSVASIIHLLDSPHLRQVNLNNNKPIDNTVFKVLPSSLQQLQICNTGVEGVVEVGLQGLRDLRVARNGKVTGLVGIGSCGEGILRLDVSDCAIGGSLEDQCWKPLQDSLQDLNISRTKVLLQGRFPNLRCLIAQHRQLHKLINFLLANKQLERLDISNNIPSECPATTTEQTIALRQLDMSYLKDCDWLLNITSHLEIVVARGVLDKGFGVRVLERNPKLRGLDLQDCGLSEVEICELLDCKSIGQLQKLSLRGNSSCHTLTIPPNLIQVSLPPCSKLPDLPKQLEEVWFQFDLFTKRDQHFNKSCDLPQFELDHGWPLSSLQTITKHQNLKKVVGLHSYLHLPSSQIEDGTPFLSISRW